MDAPDEHALQVGHGLFQPLRGELVLQGCTHRFRPRTAAVLEYLVRHAGRIVLKEELMQAVWPDVVVTEDSLVQCVKEIRHALGEQGREWIRTIPRQGYAFIGPAHASGSASTSSQGAQLMQRAPAAVVPAQPVWRRASSLRWKASAAVGLACAAIVSATLVLGPPRFAGSPASSPPRRSIVILPIANLTGDPDLDQTGDDITEALTDSVARSAGAVVIASSTSFAYKGQTVDVRRVGSELNVRYALQGSLRGHGSARVIALRLIDTATASHLWSKEFAYASDMDRTAMHDEVIGQIGATLDLSMTGADARYSATAATAEPHTSNLLSRARVLMRPSSQDPINIVQARALLEQVVAEDARSAEAWALLAMTYLAQGRLSDAREADLPRAEWAVRQAVSLAPHADGVRRAEGLLYFYERHPSLALGAFDYAIELNPNNAGALVNRGAALTLLGRPNEALASIERGMRLSPRDPEMPTWQVFAAVAHLHLAQDEAAVRELTPVVESHPEYSLARLFLAAALANTDRLADARTQVAQLTSARPALTISQFRSQELSSEPDFVAQRQRVYAGLRRAGLPE